MLAIIVEALRPIAIAILLLLFAAIASAWLAYGLDPRATFEWGGLTTITLTRRLQWVLLLATVVPSLILIGRVIAGFNRAPWLLGLALVVGLLFVRFTPGERRPVRELDGPEMPAIATAAAEESQHVVGLVFEDVPYAFSYAGLTRTPIVQLTDFDRRLLLIFSPLANSATAITVDREVRAADLEYVSSPANSTLVYNRKYGQFIVGVTGLSPDGTPPINSRGTLDTWRGTLGEWKRLHPDSRWMPVQAADLAFSSAVQKPLYPVRLPVASPPADELVTLLHTTPPAAVLLPMIRQPLNTKAGTTPVVMWADGPSLRVFERVVDGDLFLTFKDVTRRGEVLRIDEQTESVWSVNAVCTDGPLKGKRLAKIRLDTDVYWGVVKHWWPGTEWLDLRQGS